MSRLYKRRLSVLLGNDREGLEVSSLRCVFKVRQWDLQTPNHLDLTVYNLAKQTEAKAQDEFTRVVIQAGYEEGPFGTVFDGSITQAYSGRDAIRNSDTFLRIVAADGDVGYNYAVINKSLSAGFTARDQWSAVAEAMAEHGVSAGYITEQLPKHPSPRGVTLFGMARDVARKLAENHDANWSIQNGQLQVVPKNGYLPGPAIVLTANTGMVGLPVRTISGIEVRSLLNPQLVLGRPLQIDNRSIQTQPMTPSLQGELDFTNLLTQVRLDADGFYRVLRVDHVGDSRGNDWYSDVTAVALRDPAPDAAVVRGAV